MRKFLLLTGLALLLIVFVYQVVRLNLLACKDDAIPEQLTVEERLEDFDAFIRLAGEYYPFTEAIPAEKGLDDFWQSVPYYRQAVENASGNREFVRLIGEMVQRLEQGTAHCDIVAPEPGLEGLELWSRCLTYGISKKAYLQQEYWYDLLDLNRKFTHSELRTVYRNGEYVVTDSLIADSVLILPGSRIDSIDGKSVDEYVKALHHKIWLRFDTRNEKVYSHHSPFLTDIDTLRPHWNVRLSAPDGSVYSVRLEKKEGYQPAPGITYPEENLTCIELDSNTAYIKVLVFHLSANRQQDLVKLDSFFAQAGDGYEKLIIDIRGNLGGAPAYWDEALFSKLIHEPIEHVQYAIVKKPAYDQLRYNRRLFRWKFRKEINLGVAELIDREAWPWDELPDYINPEEYYLLKAVKVYEPADPYEFRGDIILLTDHDAFSAADDLSKTMKETDVAILAGANTIGGAAVVFAPWMFDLPNSHILISMEIDMAFNPDGTVNEIYGTAPHHELQPIGYPTIMPAAYEKDALLNDPWIRYAMDSLGQQ